MLRVFLLYISLWVCDFENVSLFCISLVNSLKIHFGENLPFFVAEPYYRLTVKSEKIFAFMYLWTKNVENVEKLLGFCFEFR